MKTKLVASFLLTTCLTAWSGQAQQQSSCNPEFFSKQWIYGEAGEPVIQVRASRSGELIYQMEGPDAPVCELGIFRGVPRLLLFHGGDNDRHHIEYRRRRPEPWYGVVWLPEFWLTLVLGVGLLWSVWRDRKMLVSA